MSRPKCTPDTSHLHITSSTTRANWFSSQSFLRSWQLLSFPRIFSPFMDPKFIKGTIQLTKLNYGGFATHQNWIHLWSWKYKGVQLESKHNGPWSATAWLLHRLCYRTVVFFHYICFIALSSRKKKFCMHFGILFVLLKTFTSLKLQ